MDLKSLPSGRVKERNDRINSIVHGVPYLIRLGILASCATVISISGCGQPIQNKGQGNNKVQGNARKNIAQKGDSKKLEWLTRKFDKHRVAVEVPEGWSVSPSGVFSAYSSEGLAAVLMKPAQILRGSTATTARDYLNEKLDSYEKFEVGQPIRKLGQGDMTIAGTQAAWEEMSLEKPPTLQRVFCVVLDKPYIIFCWARHENSGERSEDRREFSHEEYREMVLKIVKSIRQN